LESPHEEPEGFQDYSNISDEELNAGLFEDEDPDDDPHEGNNGTGQ
jgi:hypothetical protein